MIKIKTNILSGNVMMMTLYPFLLINKKYYAKLKSKDYNHENIHAQQQKEMLIVFFYVWYVLEYLVRLVIYKGNFNKAYFNISFEREAYENEANEFYLKHRNFLNFFNYL